MGFQDAPSGGGGGGRKLSLASVGFAGAGVGTRGTGGGGGGYKDLLVMALPKDDGARAVEVVGAGLPDLGEAVRVRTPLPF
jgi:solute carrier family 25 phosphate transporter 23/24/25/41